MERYNCNAICEIGISRGRNFSLMIEHGPELAVAIDLWQADGTYSRNDGGYSQEQLDEQYDNFKSAMVDKPFVEIFRGYSIKVAELFPDDYFDFIYVDGDHSYKGCLGDIKAWYPKMKPGMVLVGDDYWEYRTKTGFQFQVIEAVDDFAKEHSLEVHVLPRNRWAMIRE